MKRLTLKSLADLPVQAFPSRPKPEKLDRLISQLEEAYQGVPLPTLTPEDVNRLAAEDDERRTEGRCHVNRRPQTHE